MWLGFNVHMDIWCSDLKFNEELHKQRDKLCIERTVLYMFMKSKETHWHVLSCYQRIETKSFFCNLITDNVSVFAVLRFSSL